MTRGPTPRAAALLLLLLGVPTGAEAQGSRERLRESCADAGPARCIEGALAVEALTGGVGLALSGGNEFPGSASTLGRRFETTPRVAVGARLGVVDMAYPGLRSGAEELGSRSAWVPSLQAALAVGVFDGFRPRPTVGGVLSVDLLATGGVAFLPGGDGFDGSAAAFGYGVRLGLLRESFTLPGITVSAVRRHGGRVEWNGADGALPEAVVLDGVTTTSLRGTVGREFMALGISAGVGWDRASSDGSFDPQAAFGDGSLPFRDFSAERVLFFGGVTVTWLVAQFHAEMGYASGFEALDDPLPGSYDPTAGSLLASAGFRILF